MAAKLKISADTSEVKKSLMDLSKSLNSIKGSKVAIFNADDKKFIKTEMKKEMALIKQRIKDNREEISKMVAEQQKLTQGSKEELEVRKQILAAYKTQAKLGKDLGSAQKNSKSVSGGNGIMDYLTGGVGGILGAVGSAVGGGALAAGAYGIMRGVQATGQYKQGVGGRNRLKGLGVDDENFGSAQDLGRVGLTEQEMIQRRNDATSVLGRQGTNNATEMNKAGFERAYGLEGGTMTGVASQFRGQVGGQGATDMQMKLQASILASGIEDAIGPYLQSAVSLLTNINDNGTSNTAEMTSLFAQLSKDGERTPELLAKTFGNLNNAVKGASGESSAFLQTAFSRAGIGGGTVGGTKYAMSSGGLMGMSRGELEKRGYNKELLDNMGQQGMFSGVGQRTDAIMSQFKESAGLKPGEKISDIKDTNRMVGVGNLANNVLGTKGNDGFDALMMLEKVQNKQMSQKDFDKKMKDMQEGKDPQLSRLDKINGSLSGQTELLGKINENLMEALGKQGVVAGNALTKVDNQGIIGATNLATAVNSTGAVEGAGNAAEGAGKYLNSGGLGGSLYDGMFKGGDDYRMKRATDDQAVDQHRRKMLKQWHPDWSQDQINQHIKDKPLSNGNANLTAKDIGKEVANALMQSPISTNVTSKVTLPDGTVSDRTNK